MLLERLRHWYGQRVPYNRALGLRAVEVLPDGMVGELPYAAELVGNRDTGVLHGGAVTGFIDATCGAAVVIALRAACRVATLDLRIDYLKPAQSGRSVLCRAHCYKSTRNVAFVRAVAHQGDETDPIASAVGTFMIFRDERLTDVEARE